jgi:hypothetical protein
MSRLVPRSELNVPDRVAVLNVGDRRVPGCSGEASFERSLRQSGAFDQLGDGCGDRERRPQPLLRLEHDRVAVIARRVERHVRSLPVSVPLQEQELGECLRRGRPDVARDEVQDEIVPGRRRPGHDELLTLPGRDQDLFEAEPDVREVAPERGRVRRVDRGIPAGEQARLGDQQDA